MRTRMIYNEYENKLDKLQYRYRKEILEHVFHYLEITNKDPFARKIIQDRIIYQHHDVLGF